MSGTSTTVSPGTTSTAAEERDINDIFDDINSLEENAEQRAYDLGHAEAIRAGNTEGYHLGFHRGAELGAELGYYAGVVAVYRAHLQPKEEAGTKIAAAFEAVEKAIALVPATNDENVDIFDRMDKVRSLYRRLCALLKISGRYPEADTLNF